MHLLIPFASDPDPGCRAQLAALRLPALEGLLAGLVLADTDQGADEDLSLPHERALARALGLPLRDGLLPLAALEAQQRALPAPHAGWAWVTPAHCFVGQAHVSLQSPTLLALREDESRTLLAAMAPYFEEDGISLHYAAPDRWLACAAAFAELPTASLDRVAGRDVGPWMPEAPALRRLQNEMQMLLYTHPVNDARAAAGMSPVNTFWLSGTGPLPSATNTPAADAPATDLRLRAPALECDWPRWQAAWQALDSERGGPLLQAVRQGDEAVSLTLAGARSALQFRGTPRSWWQRLLPRRPGPTLATLAERL